jgi:hypothetical protein
MDADWNDRLDDFKMNATTTEFAAGLLSKQLIEEDRERLLPYLYVIGDYEMEFIYSFAIHMVDMLAEIEKNTGDDDHQNLEIDDLIKYTLQHMGIDGHIK